jgi:hypothetical protein
MAHTIQAHRVVGVLGGAGLACWAIMMVASMLVACLLRVMLAAVRTRVTVRPDDGSHHQSCCSKCCNRPFWPQLTNDGHPRFSSALPPYCRQIRRHQDYLRGQRAFVNATVYRKYTREDEARLLAGASVLRP